MSKENSLNGVYIRIYSRNKKVILLMDRLY
jgi:hypothetical protein